MKYADYGRIIAKHYGLNRPITLAEVKAEIANLQRRKIAETLDDNQQMLAAKLRII